MDYVRNELKRCEAGLQKECGEKYSYLHAVQQALCWVLGPMSNASPVDTIEKGKIGTMGAQERAVDGSTVHCPQQGY